MLRLGSVRRRDLVSPLMPCPRHRSSRRHAGSELGWAEGCSHAGDSPPEHVLNWASVGVTEVGDSNAGSGPSLRMTAPSGTQDAAPCLAGWRRRRGGRGRCSSEWAHREGGAGRRQVWGGRQSVRSVGAGRGEQERWNGPGVRRERRACLADGSSGTRWRPRVGEQG